MNISLNNILSKSIMYSSSHSYKPKKHFPNPKIFNNQSKIINKGINQNLPQSSIYSKLSQDNFTNLSSISGFEQNISNTINNSSYDYIINTNESNSGIYNDYTNNPTYKSITQSNIYSDYKILPTDYLGTKMSKSKIFNYKNNLKYNDYTVNSQKSNIQPVQNIITTTEPIEKKEYYAPTIDIPSYITPQVSNYQSQQVSRQNNAYNYNNDYDSEINSRLINELVDNQNTNRINNNYDINTDIDTNIDINEFTDIETYIDTNIENNIDTNINTNIDSNTASIIDTNTNVNTNKINNIIIKESNILIPAKKEIKEKNKVIYQEPKVKANNYLINSPLSYEESVKSPKYNSYIYKSSEITYKKNYLFSPIQSPLANYESQSYDGDNNINIEEILKLKEENEINKQKIKELENKYQAQKEEARVLRMQVEQLSLLKDKLSEIDLLRTQLLELNELKNRINQLEIFKYNIEEQDINDQLIIRNQDNKEEIESETKSKKTKIKQKEENNKKLPLNEKLENKNSKIKLEKEYDPDYVKGEIIHSIEELTMIIEKINKNNNQITLNLLYKATADSDEAEVFHRKCDEAKNSIVLIETDKGKRFGGYTSVNWKGKGLNKKDKNSFVFSLDNMEVYENIKGEKAIGCYPKFGPVFLGCQIRIYDKAFKNGGTTFKKGFNFDTKDDYVLTGGERKFKIKEIEVYEVIAQ